MISELRSRPLAHRLISWPETLTNFPSDPALVVDEDVTAENFNVWLDHRQKGTPIATSVSAAETLAEIRVYGEQRHERVKWA